MINNGLRGYWKAEQAEIRELANALAGFVPEAAQAVVPVQMLDWLEKNKALVAVLAAGGSYLMPRLVRLAMESGVNQHAGSEPRSGGRESQGAAGGPPVLAAVRATPAGAARDPGQSDGGHDRQEPRSADAEPGPGGLAPGTELPPWLQGLAVGGIAG